MTNLVQFFVFAKIVKTLGNFHRHYSVSGGIVGEDTHKHGGGGVRSHESTVVKIEKTYSSVSLNLYESRLVSASCMCSNPHAAQNEDLKRKP